MINFGKEMAKNLPLIAREFHKKLEETFSRENISITHIVVLDILSQTSCTMGTIAQKLGLTMSAVTVIIDKMIELDYVTRERSNEDRRIVNVTITGKGKEFIDKVNKAREEISNDVFSVLDIDEKEKFLTMMRKVHENLGKKHE